MSMLDRSKTYYAVKMGSGKYVLRQTRYREQLLAGDEHPHDVVAVGVAADDLRRVVSQVFADDADLSALGQPDTDPETLNSRGR